MKVLHVVPNYSPYIGGIESIVQDLANSQIASGMTALVVFPDRLGKFPEEYDVDGVRVLTLQFSKQILPLFVIGLPLPLKQPPKAIAEIFSNCRKILYEVMPDLVHIHTASEMALPILAVGKSMGIPIVFHLHGEFIDRSIKPAELRLLENTNIVVTVSCAVERSIASYIKPGTKVFPILNGLNIPEVLSTYDYQKPIQIIMAGRFTPEKGFSNGIRAFATFLSLYPDATLKLVGNGPQRYKLQQLAQDLGIGKSVDFCGVLNRKELLVETAKSFCAIVPSIGGEGFGLFAAEASSVGLPVIASDLGGLPEVIENNVSGILVTPGESHEISTALTYLATNLVAHRNMGLAGRRNAIAKFSFSQFASKIEEIYKFALGEER